MEKYLLEVCCGSADDVFAAAAAGADRVELNAALLLGGLTPTPAEVTLAQKAGLPIMAMARPREGGFCYSQREFETLVEDARLLAEAGVEGVVFGILKEDATIDTQRCEQVLKAIGPCQSVFHKAFDETPNWRDALDTLCRLGFTRVLTSGQKPDVTEGADTLREMQQYAAGRIEILPGGGVRPANAAWLLQHIGCGQLHASMRRGAVDAASKTPLKEALAALKAPPADLYWQTDTDGVAALLAAMGRG